MANLNYNQRQTALILGGRSKVVQLVYGDLFGGTYDYTTVSEFNAMVDAYLQMETDIHTAITGGFTVTGKDSNNSNVNIDDDPSHPFPIHKSS